MSATLRPQAGTTAYRGWTMAFVAFMTFALSVGAPSSTMPLIYGAVVADTGWSLTEAMLVYTYKSIAAAAATLALVGPLVARFGLRRVMLAAILVTAGGMIAYLAVDSRLSYYVVGIVQGVGLAMVVVSASLLVSRWFVHNQGVALGLALTGMSVGGAVSPLIAEPLITMFGWREAMASMSLLILLVVLPLYVWKAREAPTDAELAQEPMRPAIAQAGAAGAGATAPANSGAGPADPSSPAFWRIAAALLLIGFADMAMIQHLPLLLEVEAGFGRDTAAWGLSVVFAFGVIGKIFAGRIYDRYSLQGMRIWYLFVAISIVLILPVVGLVTLVLFAAVRGLAHGGLLPKPAVLAKHCYGARHMDAKLPLFLGIWMTGAGLGPVLLAMTFEATGEYRAGLALLVGFCILAAVLLKPVPRTSQRGSAGLS